MPGGTVRTLVLIVLALSPACLLAQTIAGQRIALNNKEGREYAYFPPENTTADYGRGYDALLGIVMPNRCLAYRGEDDLTPKPTGARTLFTLREIKDQSSFQEEFALSASLSLGIGPFKGSATHQRMSSMKSSSLSHFLVLRNVVHLPERSLREPTWTKVAIDAMKRGASQLRGVCGTHVVTSLVRGGDLSIAYQLTTKESEEHVNTSSSVTASVAGYGGGQFTLAQAVTQLNSHSNLGVSLAREGTYDRLPELTPAGLEQNAREFPERLAANDSYVAILAIAWPLSLIAPPAGCGKKCEKSLASWDKYLANLRRLAERQTLVKAKRDSVSDVVVHPYLFINPPDEATLKELERNLLQQLADLQTTADVCSKVQEEKQCDSETSRVLSQAVPGLSVKAKTWTEIDVKTSVQQAVGQTDIQGKKCIVEFRGRYRLGVEWPWVEFETGYGSYDGTQNHLNVAGSANQEILVARGTNQVSVPSGVKAYVNIGDTPGYFPDNDAMPADRLRVATYCIE
jgi:hypothetical protein